MSLNQEDELCYHSLSRIHKGLGDAEEQQKGLAEYRRVVMDLILKNARLDNRERCDIGITGERSRQSHRGWKPMVG